ncbi:MAG: PQQ-binding-like beta-propeller repeat protein [Streptosporangiales bacterium]
MSRDHAGPQARSAGATRRKQDQLTVSGIDSSPAVANGTVHVGSDDGKVYAINATTGKLRWAYFTHPRSVS